MKIKQLINCKQQELIKKIKTRCVSFVNRNFIKKLHFHKKPDIF
nr:hypothetical protein [Coxiella burnetii]